MTDKDFDALIKDALINEEVPPMINDKLLDKIKKKKSAKIISFIKPASAFAAIFVCAVAVLSFYNSDTSPVKESIPLREKEIQATESTADTTENTAEDEGAAEITPEKAQESIKVSNTEAKKNVNNVAVPEKETVIEEASPAQTAPASGAPTYDGEATAANEEAVTSDVAPEEAVAEEAVPQKFSRARMMPSPTLSGLFEEGYDYKSVINEKIASQISALPNAEEYKFSGINDDISFTLSEENILTVIFPEGEIIAEEHGEQYFAVGEIIEGKLK